MEIEELRKYIIENYIKTNIIEVLQWKKFVLDLKDLIDREVKKEKEFVAQCYDYKIHNAIRELKLP
jgi:hypothetical protein